MDPTYFTCTLGQAAELGNQQSQNNVNEFIEAQARKRVGVVLDVERCVSWDHRKLPGGY